MTNGLVVAVVVFQEMPDLLPVQSRIPQNDFGDALMVLEFIHTFQSLFDVTEYFPSGMTLGKINC